MRTTVRSGVSSNVSQTILVPGSSLTKSGQTGTDRRRSVNERRYSAASATRPGLKPTMSVGAERGPRILQDAADTQRGPA